jgi:hypothetical protein
MIGLPEQSLILHFNVVEVPQHSIKIHNCSFFQVFQNWHVFINIDCELKLYQYETSVGKNCEER